MNSYWLNKVERKLFLTEESQLINVVVIMQLENHHLASTTIITDSGKNYQWVLKLLSESLMINKVLTWSQRYLLILLINNFSGET